MTRFCLEIYQLMYGALETVGIIELSSYGKAQVEVIDSTNKTKTMYIPDMKYILSTDKVISKLPYYQSFGRQSKLGTNAKHIPSLKWKSAISKSQAFKLSSLNYTALLLSQVVQMSSLQHLPFQPITEYPRPNISLFG